VDGAAGAWLLGAAAGEVLHILICFTSLCLNLPPCFLCALQSMRVCCDVHVRAH
jgi:hypothetical protein